MKNKSILIILLLIISFNIYAADLPSKKISFEFTDTPLSNILNAICNSNGINLLFDSTNDRNVSITFDNVETKKAIELLTMQNQLDYIYKDNILIIDIKEDIKNVYSDGPKTVPGNTNLLINESKEVEVASLIIDEDYSKEDENKEKEDPGYRIQEGINIGTLIPAELIVGLISSSQELPALAKTTKTISYKGQIIIPKGTLFYGYGITDYNSRKIYVKLEKLILGDREIDIKAHLIQLNGEGGFCTEYRDLEMEKFWPSFLMNFAGMISNGFKDKYYITDDNGNQQPVESDTLKNDMIEGTQEGINSWTNKLMSDAKNHNAIITVDPGLSAFIFIDKKIALENLIEKKGE